MKAFQIGNLESIKSQNKKVVLSGGCFDILHEGHIEFLQKAKSQGDVLVILLESDAKIKKTKGENRPVHNYSQREKALSRLSFIDFIIPIPHDANDQTYINVVKELEPDIIAITKGDPLTEIKKRQAELVGGKVVEVMTRNKKFSSSKLITK